MRKPDWKLHARPASAFTLIELLVVVAIIVVLIAILMPALNKAKMQAQAVACAANARSIDTAMMVYADENGRLPYAGIKTGNTAQVSWDELISGQLGENFTSAEIASVDLPHPMKVMICPSDKIELSSAAGPHQYKRSYAVPVADIDGNGETDTLFAYSGSATLPAKFKSYKITDADNPGGTLMVVERANNYNLQGTTNNCTAQYTNDQYCNTNSSVPIAPNGTHDGKWNYGFADGHVELLRDLQTWGPKAAKNGMWWSYGAWTRTGDD